MKFNNFCLVILLLSLANISLAKTFSRCSLARAMYALGIPKSELARWTCIAEHESKYRTDIIGPANSDGSHDYGIFQINDRYWCQPNGGHASKNNCHVNCNSLLTDNIKDSVMCAEKIKSIQGWKAWSVWKYCSGNLPSINDCF
ncbi:lysozyme 1-like [Lucilia cuprina]|uniref:lysozyme 1-like n=1 Tax=Lucilia cuprina TaxID=7375 RepID=UPI001F05203F|nr:lysozyme 1-like [Lucilia cuprina]XP_046811571.1 lysozyme 1-like [Lucilia cuprina]